MITDLVTFKEISLLYTAIKWDNINKILFLFSKSLDFYIWFYLTMFIIWNMCEQTAIYFRIQYDVMWFTVALKLN